MGIDVWPSHPFLRLSPFTADGLYLSSKLNNRLLSCVVQ